MKKIRQLVSRWIENNVYFKVIYAHDLPLCKDCLEPWCPKCEDHFADCECIGPDEKDVEYIRWQGNDYARRTTTCRTN